MIVIIRGDQGRDGRQVRANVIVLLLESMATVRDRHPILHGSERLRLDLLMLLHLCSGYLRS